MRFGESREESNAAIGRRRVFAVCLPFIHVEKRRKDSKKIINNKSTIKELTENVHK